MGIKGYNYTPQRYIYTAKRYNYTLFRYKRIGRVFKWKAGIGNWGVRKQPSSLAYPLSLRAKVGGSVHKQSFKELYPCYSGVYDAKFSQEMSAAKSILHDGTVTDDGILTF